jgi:hypothetical protein
MNLNDVTRMAWANGYMLREKELLHLLPLFQVIADAAKAEERILAAPDMLAALQRLVHPMADDTDLENALEVIARATGAA